MQSALAERAIGFLRKRIARAQTPTGTKNFLAILPKLVKSYNESVHSATKFTPVEAQLEENQPEVWHNLYGKLVGKRAKPFEFRINQLVRISKSKLIFQKASKEENWSREIFKIYKRYRSYPSNYYALKDTTAKQEIIKGMIQSIRIIYL